MEPGSPSSNSSEPPNYKWADIIGALIALITIAVPTLVIAYYSSNAAIEILPQTSYSPPK